MPTAIPRDAIQLTFLGSGTSMGVPTLGCRCRVCTSADAKDKRTRPSVLLQHAGKFAVIDTSPDFRTQALREGLKRLDAVLLTHGHADHILGFDDIRPFNMHQKSEIPVYASAETLGVLRRIFPYVFDDTPAVSTVPQVRLHEVDGPFEALGMELVPIPLLHGDLPVLGFRFGRGAYLTDFSAVPEGSKQLLAGLDHLVLDALRDTPHPMHMTVEQALALVRELNPQRAWFTHIAHDLPHEETNARLRKLGFSNVELSYDGLSFEVALA